MDNFDENLHSQDIAHLRTELANARKRERAAQKNRQALETLLQDLEKTRVESEQARLQLQNAIDAIRDPIFMHDEDMLIIRANRAYAEYTGLDFEQIIGKPYWQLFPKLDSPPRKNALSIQHRQGHEEELILSSNEIFLFRHYPIFDRQNNYLYSLQMMHNVTEQRLAEAEHRTLSEALRQAAEAILVLDHKGNVRHINPAFENLFGFCEEEIIGQPPSFLDAADHGRHSYAPCSVDQTALRENGVWQGEVLKQAKDGSTVPVLLNASAIRDKQGIIAGFIYLFLDLRQIKQAESSLRESEEQFRAMSSAAQDAILMIDQNSCLMFWNEAATRIFGYEANEVLGQNVHMFLAPERYYNAYKKNWPLFARSGQGPVLGKVLELEALHKNGTEINIELSVAPVRIKQRWHAVGILRDITERKRAERKLQNVLRAHRTLSACNMLLVHSTQEEQLMNDMCHTIVELGGYRLAWIGQVEHDENKTIKPIASAGDDCDYLSSLQLTWADTALGHGPAGRAVRMAAAQMANNIDNDPRFMPWRDQALARGFASCISLPLTNESDGVFAVVNIYAAEANAFDESEKNLLQELAGDLAFGLHTLKTRRERDHFQQQHLKAVEQHKEALTGTIRAIAMTVEKRDPYTAGHQSRVADLAAAIAVELGLEPDRIEGLRLGATIHDIGKIYIPAEILNRPGSLSEHEFGMIKSHAEVGYEIIKDVNFPWPVAKMVLQHHERLDGSGYPNGLKGDEIILEARILAAADAVEAICAHRPYRPGLGIELALTELETHRGVLYDTDVADACLRLFREKNYQFAN